MSTITANNKHELNVISNFSEDERMVSSNKHQSVYVPAIYLPEEVKFTLCRSSYVFEMVYTLDEPVKETTTRRDVEILIGINTKRIYKIEAVIEKPSFVTLTNRMQDARKSLLDLKNESHSIVQKKNYELVLKLLNKVISSINADRSRIVSHVFNAVSHS